MKVPTTCPWCGSLHVAVSGAEMTALKGMIRYQCGTSVSLYLALVQISASCSPSAQWLTHEQFAEVLTTSPHVRS